MNMGDVDWIPTLYLDEAGEFEDETTPSYHQDEEYHDVSELNPDNPEHQTVLLNYDEMPHEGVDTIEFDHQYSTEELSPSPPRKKPKILNTEAVSKHPVITQVITLPLSAIAHEQGFAQQEEQYESIPIDDDNEEEVEGETEEVVSETEVEEVQQFQFVDKVCQTDLTSADIAKYIRFYERFSNRKPS